MRSRSRTLGLALVAAGACVSSVAAADGTTNGKRQEQPAQQGQRQQGQQQQGQQQQGQPDTIYLYREDVYETQPTTQPAPSTSSTTQTTSAEYNEMAGAEREKTLRPNRPMLITGGALLVAPYVAGVVVAAQSNLDADKRNYIPVVGPWLDLGQRPCTFGSACTTTDNVGSALLIGSGVAQGLGLILAAASFAVPEQTTERVEPPKASMQVTPVSFAGGGGLGALGTF